MNEALILAEGYFVKHYTPTRDKTEVFSNVYCLPLEKRLGKNQLSTCIEVNVFNGQTTYLGKAGCLRFPLRTPEEYYKFISFAIYESQS